MVFLIFKYQTHTNKYIIFNAVSDKAVEKSKTLFTKKKKKNEYLKYDLEKLWNINMLKKWLNNLKFSVYDIQKKKKINLDDNRRQTIYMFIFQN